MDVHALTGTLSLQEKRSGAYGRKIRALNTGVFHAPSKACSIHV